MKKILGWLVIIVLLLISGGYLRDFFSPHPIMVYPPLVPNAAQAHSTQRAEQPGGPKVLATALLTPQETKTPAVRPVLSALPSPLPDYTPGQGQAVLSGGQITLLPGGWQAYQIGPSSSPWGYLVDVTPLEPAVNGAHVEWKILPEYYGAQWVDVLWLRSPEILQPLPLLVDLISTEGWNVIYQADVELTSGDWAGFGMFPVRVGQDPPAAGVLDINVTAPNQEPGTAIQAVRVQPEFPGEWLQVARLQLTGAKDKLPARLVYYNPGALAEQAFYLETTLSPGVWSGWSVSASEARQGYLVEVIPLEALDNEVANSVVQPEFNGQTWQDVLRVYVPEGRPRLDAIIRVYSIPVAQP